MARQMKDSGVKWIGEIPAEWKVEKVKHIADTISKGYGITKEDVFENGDIQCVRYGEIYSKYDGSFVSTNSRTNENAIAAPKHIFSGDILFAGTGELVEEIGKNIVYMGNEPCLAGGDIIVMSHSQNPIFLNYALNCNSSQAQKSSGKAKLKVVHISSSDIGNVVLALPSLTEQHRIADFLDAECARIDAVIEKTRASIEEYKKLKQSVITQAVTKGIRPGRKMKDSGIEWIGEIPEEWEVSRIGLHFDIILGKMLCSNQPSEDYSLESYYCAANVHFDGISNSDIKQMWFSPAEKEQYSVCIGDLLVVEGGAGAGGCAVVAELAHPTYIQNSIMIVRSKGNANNNYLRYLTEHLVEHGYIDVVCNKATIPHFTKDKLSNVPFLISDEQVEIAEYLDTATTKIGLLIAKKERFLAELESYKKFLIYEYVTGKKEVM